MLLTLRRKFGQYGTINPDGTFDYGLIPEASFNWQVVDFAKHGCSEAPEGYVCAHEMTLQFAQSSSMRGAFGNDPVIEGVLDYLNGVAASTGTSSGEDVFVLTPAGWRSPTLAAAALNGIERGVETLFKAGEGFSCGLQQITGEGDDFGGGC